MEQTAPPLFTRKDLIRLILPLVIEQILAVTIGMADSVMVSSVGEAAVSGVSLVDSVNILFINIFFRPGHRRSGYRLSVHRPARCEKRLLRRKAAALRHHGHGNRHYGAGAGISEAGTEDFWRR